MLLDRSDKRRVCSPSQSFLLHGEQRCDLAKARLLRHLSRRFAVVDSYPEARVRAGLQEDLDGREIIKVSSNIGIYKVGRKRAGVLGAPARPAVQVLQVAADCKTMPRSKVEIRHDRQDWGRRRSPVTCG